MNHIRIARSLMTMSRIGGIYDLELRSDGEGTRAWGRADGVLRTLLVFPTAYVPALRLRIRHEGWALQSERHAGGISILCFSNVKKRPALSQIEGLDSVEFPSGKITVCTVASHTLFEEVGDIMARIHPSVRMYSGEHVRSALYSALLGDAVCILTHRAESFTLQQSDRMLFESLSPSAISVRHERRICPTCTPAGSGCTQCENTGFSDRRAVVTV